MKTMKMIDMKLAIRSPEKMSRMTETTSTPIAAAAKPWAKRSTRSVWKSGAKAQAKPKIT